MSGDETADQQGEHGDASRRARLVIAGAAAALLAVIITVVVATRESEDEPSELLSNACFEAWNEDALAPVQDGTHAYSEHGYREALVTRIDREGRPVGLGDDSTPPDDPAARCAVIFASPQVDEEPDFGVRVYDEGRWTGLVLADETPLREISDLQADAVADANAVLASNGILGAG